MNGSTSAIRQGDAVRVVVDGVFRVGAVAAVVSRSRVHVVGYQSDLYGGPGFDWTVWVWMRDCEMIGRSTSSPTEAPR